MLRNFLFFVGSDHQNLHRRPVFLDFGNASRNRLVSGIVDGDSEMFKPQAHALPDHAGVLTDAAGEHDGVHAAEHCEIRTDTFLDAVAEDVDGQFCAIVSKPCLIDDFPHVVQPANALEAALRIERFLQIIRRHARLPHHKEVDRRIDVSRPRAHHQAFKRGQAHGRVDARASLNGCCTCSVAQMERDEIHTLGCLAQIPGCLS